MADAEIANKLLIHPEEQTQYFDEEHLSHTQEAGPKSTLHCLHVFDLKKDMENYLNSYSATCTRA